VLNNTYHRTIRISLMLGYHQRSYEDFAFSRLTRVFANIDSEIDREQFRNAAKLVSDSIREYNKKYKDAHCKTPSVYRKGDYVLIRDLRTKRKVQN